MKYFRRSHAAAALALFYLTGNVVLAHSAEVNLWSDRRKAIAPIQVASLSASFQTLNQLPTPKISLDNTPKWKTKNHQLNNFLTNISAMDAHIQDVHDSGAASPPLLLIQDIHMNNEAQGHIAALLQDLIKQNQVGLVGVEGAFHSLDFETFRRLPRRAITNQITRSYFDSKRLSAPSYVGVTSRITPPPFVGVDDKTHYDANVQAYLDSRDGKEKILQELEKESFRLGLEKGKLFSLELKRFDALRRAHHESKIGFGNYVQQLKSFEEDSSLIIDRFLEAYEMEIQLDFDRVESERRAVISRLAEKLVEKDLADLVEQSVAYRTGDLSFGAYYANLKKLCERSGVDLTRFPHFNNYVRYALLSDGILADELFTAVEIWEGNIVNDLAHTPEEKRLIAESEHLTLTRKLLDFSLTPKEWERYKKNPPGLPIANHGEEFENFYREADLRSDIMVKNLVRGSWNKDLSKPKVLVVGGFHTPRITELLKEKKVSYVVVSPKLTKIEDESGSAYLSVFAREKTPLDKVFSGEKLFLSPPTHLEPGQPVYSAFVQDAGAAHSQVVAGAPPQFRGALMVWLAKLAMPVLVRLLPHVSTRHHALYSLPLMENAFSLMAGTALTFWVHGPGANHRILIVSAGLASWFVFGLLHLMDFLFRENRPFAIRNFKPMASVMASGVLLSLLPLPMAVLIAIQIVGLYLWHVQINLLVSSIAMMESVDRGLAVITDSLSAGRPIPIVSEVRTPRPVRKTSAETRQKIEMFLRMLEDYVHAPIHDVPDRAQYLAALILNIDPTWVLQFVPFIKMVHELKNRGSGDIYDDWPLVPELMERGYYFEVSPDPDSNTWPPKLALSYFRILEVESGAGPSLSTTIYVERINGEKGEGSALRGIPGQLVVREEAPPTKEAFPPFWNRIPQWKLFVFGWPLLETLAFQTTGISLFQPEIVGAGFSLSSYSWIGLSISAFAFGFGHTIVSWFVRSKIIDRHRGRDFFVRATLFFVFSLPFLLINQMLISTSLTYVLHASYNALVLSRWGIFRILPLAALGPASPSLRKINLKQPDLVLPNTYVAGRSWGLRDRQIREDYAPPVESLAVLNPLAFWKAHNDPRNGLNKFAQAKRKVGIAQIWAAMITTAALPGGLIFVGVFMGHLFAQFQIPLWMFWAPPAITALVSIGWGYVLSRLGTSQKLLDAENPYDIIHSPLFWLYLPAFYGNRWAHRYWNIKHPNSALVNGDDFSGETSGGVEIGQGVTAVIPYNGMEDSFPFVIQVDETKWEIDVDETIEDGFVMRRKDGAGRVLKLAPHEYSEPSEVIYGVYVEIAPRRGLIAITNRGEDLLAIKPYGPMTVQINPPGFTVHLVRDQFQAARLNEQQIQTQLVRMEAQFRIAFSSAKEEAQKIKAVSRLRSQMKSFFRKGAPREHLLSFVPHLNESVCKESGYLLVLDPGAFQNAFRLFELGKVVRRGEKSLKMGAMPYVLVKMVAVENPSNFHGHNHAGKELVLVLDVVEAIPRVIRSMRFSSKPSPNKFHSVASYSFFMANRDFLFKAAHNMDANEAQFVQGLIDNFLIHFSEHEERNRMLGRSEIHHEGAEELLALLRTIRDGNPHFEIGNILGLILSGVNHSPVLLWLLGKEADRLTQAQISTDVLTLVEETPDQLKARAARAYKKLDAQWRRDHNFPSDEETSLVLEATKTKGETLGRSDRQIREDYAPPVESLAVLNPLAFWKAHNDPRNGLNKFAQAKRKMGIAHIWGAMVVTAALPGGLISFGIFIGHLFAQNQIPLWLYWAPPVMIALVSIGWGYVLSYLGTSQKLLDAENPYDIIYSPIFWLYLPAFYGNRWAHRRWNKRHPHAALTVEYAAQFSQRFPLLSTVVTPLDFGVVVAPADFVEAMLSMNRNERGVSPQKFWDFLEYLREKGRQSPGGAYTELHAKLSKNDAIAQAFRKEIHNFITRYENPGHIAAFLTEEDVLDSPESASGHLVSMAWEQALHELPDPQLELMHDTSSLLERISPFSALVGLRNQYVPGLGSAANLWLLMAFTPEIVGHEEDVDTINGIFQIFEETPTEKLWPTVADWLEMTTANPNKYQSALQSRLKESLLHIGLRTAMDEVLPVATERLKVLVADFLRAYEQVLTRRGDFETYSSALRERLELLDRRIGLWKKYSQNFPGQGGLLVTPVAPNTSDAQTALEKIITSLGQRLYVMPHDFHAAFHDAVGNEFAVGSSGGIPPQKYNLILEYLYERSQKSGGQEAARIYRELLPNNAGAKNIRAALDAFFQSGEIKIFVDETGLLSSPQAATRVLAGSIWSSMMYDSSFYFRLAIDSMPIVDRTIPVFTQMSRPYLTHMSGNRLELSLLYPYAFSFLFPDSVIKLIAQVFERISNYRYDGENRAFVLGEDMGQIPTLDENELAFWTDLSRLKKPVIHVIFEILFEHLVPHLLANWKAAADKFLLVYRDRLKEKGQYDAYVQEFSRADASMRKTHSVWQAALKKGSPLVLTSTYAEGHRRGLSDQETREDFAPAFEALDVLRPYKFWIEHNDPRNGDNGHAQNERKRGIAFIWAAMILTSAFPGLIGVVAFDVTRGGVWWGWFVLTPLLFSAVSIGWGYLMRSAGVPLLLSQWKQPYLLFFHPFFLPFFPAFLGNEWAHRHWNVTHPESALVRKKNDTKTITAEQVWRMILSDMATQKFAKDGRLTINILTANFSVSDGSREIHEALKQLVVDNRLKIIRVAGPITYYGFVDAKKALVGKAPIKSNFQALKVTPVGPVAPVEFKVGQRVSHSTTGTGQVVKVTQQEIVIDFGDAESPTRMTLTPASAQTAVAAGRLIFLQEQKGPNLTSTETDAAREARLIRRYSPKIVDWVKAIISEKEWSGMHKQYFDLEIICASFSGKTAEQSQKLRKLLGFVGAKKYVELAGSQTSTSAKLLKAMKNMDAASSAVGLPMFDRLEQSFKNTPAFRAWFADWEEQILNGEPSSVAEFTKELANEFHFMELVGKDREEAAKLRPAKLLGVNALMLRQRVSFLRSKMGTPDAIHHVLDQAGMSPVQKKQFWNWLINKSLAHLNRDWFQRFVKEGAKELRASNVGTSNDPWLRPLRMLSQAIFGTIPLVLLALQLSAASPVPMTSVSPRQSAVQAIVALGQTEKFFGDDLKRVGSLGTLSQRDNQREAANYVSWISNQNQGRDLIKTLLRSGSRDKIVLGVGEQAETLIENLSSDPALKVPALIHEGRLAFVHGDASTTILDLIAQAKASSVFQGQKNALLNVLLLEQATLPAHFFQLTQDQWRLVRDSALVYFISQTLQAVQADVPLLPDWKKLRAILTNA